MSGVLALLQKEIKRREKNREIIEKLKNIDPPLVNEPIVFRWKSELGPIFPPLPKVGQELSVTRGPADPAHINARITFAKSERVTAILNGAIKFDPEDLYGYSRAFANPPEPSITPLTILDPTSGGGSIPFEALRLGHKVIANELNPVASVILHATLDYPAKFGITLWEDISVWGEKMLRTVSDKMEAVTPFSPLPRKEREYLEAHCRKCSEIVPHFNVPEYDQTGILFCRQVTCPNCGGEAPLLNTCWLSKEAGKQWGVKILTNKKPKNGKAWFETYRVSGGKGPAGEDPNFATVNRAIGQCIHCKQAIEPDEIKSQARGESTIGTWRDRLYCVVAVRFQPKLDKNGNPQRYKSGKKAGQIKTEKIRFFRPPNKRDLDALEAAEKQLMDNWDRWDAAGLIPTERIPLAHKTKEPLRVGMNRWCDMFMPRQLLGHLTLVGETQSAQAGNTCGTG